MLESQETSLSEVADAFLGAEGGIELGLSGPASHALTEVVGSETHTHPLIGSLFWQAFTMHPAYHAVLRSVGLAPELEASRQEIIVRHALSTGFWSRLDLVVLDSRFTGHEPVSSMVEVDAREVGQTAEWLWRHGPEERFGARGLMTAHLIGDVVAEAAQAQRFGVIVAFPPETMLTAVAPRPAWPVVGREEMSEAASAGVVATDRDGRIGVTSANHAFGLGVTGVTVAGLPGTIRSRHGDSDSVFIEVPGLAAPATQPVVGPLSGSTPGEGETVTFDGAASGAGSTIVTGWDKGIPFEVNPWNRLRVLTEAVTDPGDSGTALLNDTNQVIGFAFDRTGFGARIAYSSWIWAEFVYMAHGLQ
jgi:hypothetical protein